MVEDDLVIPEAGGSMSLLSVIHAVKQNSSLLDFFRVWWRRIGPQTKIHTPIMVVR